ncbi:hypothetical protein IHI24_000932 [Rickettsia endosymbiont of Cardiosporidium cionae]|nr:hypothetical protein IHI24_000932 [Rickettsia endosymbiont of Cardiosporidium cionae]
MMIDIDKVRNCIISVYTTAFIPPTAEYNVTNEAANTKENIGLLPVKYSNILLKTLNCTAIAPTDPMIVTIDIIYLVICP